jgi:prepilin-type N-terminal cleavage/methylation domain-containing protein
MNQSGFIFSIEENNRGTTLIELAVVLAIVVIVGAIAAIGYGFLSADSVKSASRELFGDLQWIKHSSVTQGPDAAVPQLMGFGIRIESNHKYRLFRFNDMNSNFQYDGAAEEAFLQGETSARQKEIPLPLEIQIKSSSKLVAPHNTILLFDHLGIPRGDKLSFQQKTIVIHNPDNKDIPKKCFSISFNRIREGQWDGSNCQEQ